VIRLLVTCAGGDLVSDSIHLMRACRSDLFIVGVDRSPNAAGKYWCDAFHVVPGGAEPDYLDAILDLVHQHGVNLVLPWSDEEAIVMARHRDRFEAAGVALVCAPLEAIEVMSDKSRFYHLLAREKVAVPQFRDAASTQEIEQAYADLRDAGVRDMVVKPARSRGGRNVFLISEALRECQTYNGGRELHMGPDAFFKDYLHEAASHAPVVVMERLYAPAYDIDILAHCGRALRVVPRRRLNPAGIPAWGNVIEADPALVEIGHSVARALNLSWLYDCDVMQTHEGRYVAIEMNPRPSGSVSVAVTAGIPLFADLFDLADGKTELAPCVLPAGRKVVTYLTARILGEA